MPAFQLCLDQTGQLAFQSLPASRNMARKYHAYSCLNPDCGYEFRLKWPKPSVVQDRGVAVGCPICDGLYVEWLTFEMDPQDVYLNFEWEPKLMGSMIVRRGQGSPV